MNSRILDYTALVVTVIGAVNWGLIGFFRFNLVTFLFGDMTWISRIIYALVVSAGCICSAFSEECLPFQTIPNVFKKKKPFCLRCQKEELPL